MASYIITELLEEILVRVPIKSLLRFKSTCKRWRALIESASFVAFHARRHSLDHQNRLVFSRYDAQFNYAMYSSAASSDHNLHLTTTPLFDFGYRPSSTLNKWPLDDKDDADSPYITTLGPLTNTNGIYCIINNDRQRRNRISVATSKIALFNPATREYKFTNRFPFMEAAILTHQIARLPSLVNYGFGSVRSKFGILLDYKVVVIILSGHDHSRFLSFVYSLRRGSWKKIADVTYGARYSGDFEAVVGLVNKRGEVETPRFVDHEIVGCVVENRSKKQLRSPLER